VDSTHVRNEYNRLASEYDSRWGPYIDATLGAVHKAVEFQGDENVLDVPCGTGELERQLLTKWPNLGLTGVDVSTGMLAQAKEKDKSERVKWIEADVADLPLPNEAFDCVICANSFHYFRTPQEAILEMCRVLRPGGQLVIVDWCDDYLTCKACSSWLRWRSRAFYRTYTLRACTSLVDNAGFEIETHHRFRISWLWGLMSVTGRRVKRGELRSKRV